MSGTDVAVVAPASLAQRMEYAEALAASGMLPGHFRGRPANVLWATEYAAMLEVPAMAAITGIHIIEGKPCASAGLISALVRRGGHRLRITGDDTSATAQIVRGDDRGFTFVSTWTMARAAQAGLAGKGNWAKYPAAMLKARALTEAARDACEEALFGMHYTPEELGAEVDADGEPIEAPAPPTEQRIAERLATTHRRSPPPPAFVAAEPEPGPDAPAGRDFAAEAEALSDYNALQGLWSAARQAGALTPELRALITERGQLAAEREREAAAAAEAEQVLAADPWASEEDETPAVVQGESEASENAATDGDAVDDGQPVDAEIVQPEGEAS